MIRMRSPMFCLITFTMVFFAISKYLFNKIYITSRVVVDEEFHLPLGLAYCKYDFSVWDPKVTTLPGLYLISNFLLGPFKLCSTYWLRLISLGAAVINIFLYYILFLQYGKNKWYSVLSAITLSLLPPLYFFSHFYYTDVVSLTVILILLILNEKGYHYFASLFGMIAVLCRQNNVIWVAMLLGKYILVELYTLTIQRHSATKGIDIKKLSKFMKMILTNPTTTLRKTNVQFWLDCCSYLLVLLAFIHFLILNGSVVVGDKTAHEATLHFPQLFYFSVFCLVFAWPHFVSEVNNFILFSKKHKFLLIGWIILGLVIVHNNTLVHPYMLADNRHYIFYIWNRFYEKFTLFRYAMVPVYIFSWYVITKTLYVKEDISFLLFYLPSVFILLATQKLIDFRYYFVPYVLFRFRIRNSTSNAFNLILEFVTYVVTNSITFNLFFHKTITWSDYDFPQRLIW